MKNEDPHHNERIFDELGHSRKSRLRRGLPLSPRQMISRPSTFVSEEPVTQFAEGRFLLL